MGREVINVGWNGGKMKETVIKAASPVIKDATTKVGGMLVDEVIETFIRPKFEKIKNKPKNANKILEILESYYQKAYHRNKYMNTIVFKKETKTIDELYIPLTILKNGKERREKIVIDYQVTNIFERNKRVLVIDSAGMGKSTLSKFLYLKWIKSEYDIPFFIELRKIKKGMTILEHICEELCLSEKELTVNDIRFLVERGDFIFFLDGFDEIPKENKESTTEEIVKFILEFSENSFMLTSREEHALQVFSEFEKYHIQPLQKEEAFALIRKYDKNGSTAEKLIADIKSNKQYEILEEFLANPLMVSLLYLTYHYKENLQYKKHLFYRQVYDALYDGHDIIKGDAKIHEKKSGLSIDDFCNLLSAMGYLSVKRGMVSFERHVLKSLIVDAGKLYWHDEEIDADNIIEDILHAIPLFTEEGLEIKWSHKSFAEYFAAYFICFTEKAHENKIVKSIMNSSSNFNLYNVLDFCYDMDSKLAKEVIVYDVVTKYVQYCDEYPETITDEFSYLKRYYKFVDDVFFVKVNGEISGGTLISALNRISDEYDRNVFSDVNFISRANNVFQLHYNKPISCGIRLLYNKGIDIFEEIKCKDFSLKFMSELEDGDYWWCNNTSEILNRPDVDKALVSYIHHKNYMTNRKILEYDKCKRLKKEIERTIEKQNEDIFLFE